MRSFSVHDNGPPRRRAQEEQAGDRRDPEPARKPLGEPGSYDAIFFLLAGAVIVLAMACWDVSLPNRTAALTPAARPTNGAATV